MRFHDVSAYFLPGLVYHVLAFRITPVASYRKKGIAVYSVKAPGTHARALYGP